MINSRKIYDLLPEVASRCLLHKARCETELGIELLITSTFRDWEAQDELYAQGRTKAGRVVTNARGGDSFHQYRVAYDVVPVRDGKLVWDVEDAVWQEVGRIGEECGLEWAGNWAQFREYPHFQYTGGLTLADFKNGRSLDASDPGT